MGYTTDFEGHVTVEPPLNGAEIVYLKQFSETRRMRRINGPYYVDGEGLRGQAHEDDITDYNNPPDKQPSLWCQWVPTDDGTGIEWNGTEKFYHSEEWMTYLIDHFLKPGAVASTSGDTQFNHFTFDHVVNGRIDAQGEDPKDRWRLVVKNNVVGRIEPTVMWPVDEDDENWEEEES